jgi:hypothetical protein
VDDVDEATEDGAESTPGWLIGLAITGADVLDALMGVGSCGVRNV